MDEAWWQVESHFILCTLCCLSRVCHIIKKTFILQLSLDYVQVDVKNKKLRKWKLKNFIKLVSAINCKIYVFKGDIHKTLVDVVSSQKNHRNSQAHEKCLMSRTWTENEWKFNGIYIITAVLHCLPFHAFSSFLSPFPSFSDSSVLNITSTKRDQKDNNSSKCSLFSQDFAYTLMGLGVIKCEEENKL